MAFFRRINQVRKRLAESGKFFMRFLIFFLSCTLVRLFGLLLV